MRKLYGHPLSGNTHRVRLLLSMLALPCEEHVVDMMGGEHRKPEFLRINPLGLVPVLVDEGNVIRDSHAILVYLARRYQGGERWLPAEPLGHAQVMQWLSFSANEIQNGPNLARLHFLAGVPVDLPAVQEKARQAIKVVDERLAGREWLELDRPTIADLACFPYIGLAEEGKVSLAPFGNASAWCQRIKKLPGYVAMPGL